jgi:predicted DCC family thiol-disulfide oxidoreductase YuxK
VLCNGTARFVIANDPAARIRLATAQSASGQAILAAVGMPTDRFDTFVFVEDGRAWFRSAAMFRLLAHLRRRWRPLRVLSILPATLLDAGYDGIARNRYRLFGTRSNCLAPSPDIADRFLP